MASVSSVKVIGRLYDSLSAGGKRISFFSQIVLCDWKVGE